MKDRGTEIASMIVAYTASACIVVLMVGVTIWLFQRLV